MPSLDALVRSRHEVVGVVTRPDAPSGRGKRLTASPVAARAAELGIETLKPLRPRDDDFVTRLAEIAPDCCPVVAYGALLPQRVLDIPASGWINLHFSLLPAWRGAAPVQHAILAGDQVTGATTFRIVHELDAGPTFASIRERIQPSDTAGRPAAPAIDHRSRAARRDPRRHRGWHPQCPAAARCRRDLRLQDQQWRMRRSTGRSRLTRSIG